MMMIIIVKCVLFVICVMLDLVKMDIQTRTRKHFLMINRRLSRLCRKNELVLKPNRNNLFALCDVYNI